MLYAPLHAPGIAAWRRRCGWIRFSRTAPPMGESQCRRYGGAMRTWFRRCRSRPTWSPVRSHTPFRKCQDRGAAIGRLGFWCVAMLHANLMAAVRPVRGTSQVVRSAAFHPPFGLRSVASRHEGVTRISKTDLTATRTNPGRKRAATQSCRKSQREHREGGTSFLNRRDHEQALYVDSPFTRVIHNSEIARTD